MVMILTLVGLLISITTVGLLIQSYLFPARRVWPPRTYGKFTPVLVWTPTLTLFGTLIALGIFGWGQLALPAWVRFGMGIPILIISNIAVWSAVQNFGIAQTSGDVGTLNTGGLYRFSRNPQYVADIAQICGWLMVSASAFAIPVALATILVFLVAPFAEESWMAERYGTAYEDYRRATPRFLGSGIRARTARGHQRCINFRK